MSIEEELKGIYRNNYHKGIVNLLYTANVLSTELNEIIKDIGLTPQQYNVLRILRRYNNKPVHINFIKERMLERNSDVSRIIDKLFSKKFLTRIEDQQDRRKKALMITPLGISLLSKADEIKNVEDNLLSHLSNEEIQYLNTLLDKIRGMQYTDKD